MHRLHQLTEHDLNNGEPLSYSQILRSVLETLLQQFQQEAHQNQTLILRILGTTVAGTPDTRLFA